MTRQGQAYLLKGASKRDGDVSESVDDIGAAQTPNFNEIGEKLD